MVQLNPPEPINHLAIILLVILQDLRTSIRGGSTHAGKNWARISPHAPFPLRQSSEWDSWESTTFKTERRERISKIEEEKKGGGLDALGAIPF